MLGDGMQETIEQIEVDNKFNPTKTQAEEIMQRYGRIKHIMQQTVVEADPLQKALFNERLDDLLLHRRWGYIILLAVLFLLFQSVFGLPNILWMVLNGCLDNLEECSVTVCR